MITIFPERALSAFPLIVPLSGTARRKLNAFRDDLTAFFVINEQMDMVGGSCVIEDDNPKPLPGLKEPIEPSLPVSRKLQQEFLLVAAMSYVPHMTGNIVPIRSGHPFSFPSLRTTISGTKWRF